MSQINWKLKIGKFISKIEQTLIYINNSFINKHYPFGRNWIYDLNRNYLKTCAIIIDVGANKGDVSLDLLKFFPNSKIYAFEPIDKTFDLLRKNTVQFSNIKIFKNGLGAKEETIKILLNREDSINSCNVTHLNPQDYAGEQEVNLITLDDFCKKNELREIDILKIDVEGFEMEVLMGSAEILKETKFIFIEVGFERMETKVHFSDMDLFMEKNNFQMCGLYDETRQWQNKKRMWFANFLYINKKIY